MHLFRTKPGARAIFVPPTNIRADGKFYLSSPDRRATYQDSHLPDVLEFEREDLLADPVSMHNGNAVTAPLGGGLEALANDGWYIFNGPDGGLLAVEPKGVETL